MSTLWAQAQYTTLLLYMSLSESDSKLYTNFECCEGEPKHLLNTIYKTKQFMLTNYFSKKILLNLENGANRNLGHVIF